MIKIAILLNILLIISFFMSFLFEFYFEKSPKAKAMCAACAGITLFFYIVSLFMITIIEMSGLKYLSLVFMLFGIIPFIIGKYVKYKTLKIYSIVQLLVFILGLAFLISYSILFI